jgi:sec-independent protein translocase protein TatA
MLGDFGLPELLVIFVIVLPLFGPGKLPDVGKAIGEALRGFKKAMRADEESIEDKTAEKEKDRQQKNHA